MKLFGAAAPVAAVAPSYFFAPIGGWKSDVIVHAPIYEEIDAALLHAFRKKFCPGEALFFLPGPMVDQLREAGLIAPVLRKAAPLYLNMNEERICPTT